MLFAILVVELELSQQHIAQKLGHYPEIQIIMLITIEADFQVLLVVFLYQISYNYNI